MQFLYPGFLIALAALAIPILIHLFYFRKYKKVYFSNVAFLKEVKDESSSRRKLRNLLVLLARLLALAFLVAAFAIPFFEKDNPEALQSPQAVSIFVDNSFSMDALSSEVPLLDKAKQRSREIVNAYGNDDRFQVITHDLEGRHQHLVSKDEALAFIEEINSTAAVSGLSNVLERQKTVLASAEKSLKTVYQISDFQRNITDQVQYSDTGFTLKLVPLAAVQQTNVSIDSAWFEAPVQMLNQNNRLLVKLTNYSADPVEDMRLTMSIDGQEKPVGTFNIEGGKSAVDTVNVSLLRNGWHKATLKIADFPITFDNSYYLSFYVPEKVNVLVIHDGVDDRYLSAALSGAQAFNVEQRSRLELDYSALKNYQLIVLDDLAEISSGLGSELRQYAEGGGNVLVFPSAVAELNSYNAFLRTVSGRSLSAYQKAQFKVSRVHTEEFVFKDVFDNMSRNLRLPTTAGRYALSGRVRSEPILSYRDGKAMIEKYKVERGHVYFSAAPLNPAESELVKQAEIFVPMLYKIAISTGEQRQVAYTIGEDENLRAATAQTGPEASLRIRGDGQEFIPLVRNLGKSVMLGLQGAIKKSGFYELMRLENEQPLQVFAFNYDRRESDFSFYNTDELQQLLGSNVSIVDGNDTKALAAEISSQKDGSQLWRWCLWAVLGFLLLEVFLLRFWKV